LFKSGKPAKNVYVSVEVEGLYGGSGITDQEGVFCGKMPKDKKLKFKVNNGYCNELLYTIEVNPITVENTILDPFILPDIIENKISFEGKVVCNDQPVDQTTIILKTNNFVRVFTDLEKGLFNEDFSFLNCVQSNDTEFEIIAFDEITGKASPSKKFSYAVHKNIILNVCEAACDFTSALTFDCNNFIKVETTNGSGNYTYKWSNGATSQEILVDSTNNPTLSTYCVTVTDTGTSCTKVFCKNVSGKLQAYIEGQCSPEISTYVFGGSPPYTYLWNNGKTTSKIEDLQPGVYTVVVTDDNGCTVSAKKEVSTLLAVNPTPVSCDKNKYSLSSSIPIQGGFISPSGIDSTSFLQISNLNNLDVFKTGFEFTLSVYADNCEARFDIVLPRLESFVAEAKNTSCGTCEDGYITYTIGSNCFSCQVGEVLIYKTSDLSIDLSDKNTLKKLGKGDYYAVVLDKNTGCYIAYQKVKIN
jgi:hypothetical protein